MINHSYMLSDQDVIENEKQASAGNADAAFRLFKYYLGIKLDEQSAYKWLLVSATNGNSSAQYNLGVANEGKLYPYVTNIDQAIFWYKKALANGFSDASENIRELNSKRVAH